VTELVIRRARPSDVEDIHGIARESFARPWEPSAFREELERQFAHLFVLEASGVLAGFVSLWLLRNEARVLSFAVDPRCRRRGLGRALLAHALSFAESLGVRYASLEVRASNRAARALYAELGFEAFGVRPGYYVDDGRAAEDAIVMMLAMRRSTRAHRHGHDERERDGEENAGRDTEQSERAHPEAVR
jgi:ribosomal-protein-alanine N-acetyltransferase